MATTPPASGNCLLQEGEMMMLDLGWSGRVDQSQVTTTQPPSHPSIHPSSNAKAAAAAASLGSRSTATQWPLPRTSISSHVVPTTPTTTQNHATRFASSLAAITHLLSAGTASLPMHSAIRFLLPGCKTFNVGCVFTSKLEVCLKLK